MTVFVGIKVNGFYKLVEKLCWLARIPFRKTIFSKKMYGNVVLTFLSVYREKLNVSYRRFVEICDENNLQRMLCIKRIPHYTTLQKFLQRVNKTVFEKLVRSCRRLLNNKTVVAGIDGTGFSNTNPSHYYQKRIDGVSVKNYTKTILLADLKTKLVLNIDTCSDNRNETLSFIPLVREVKHALKCVLADKAYDSMKNREFCWNSGITTHIPLREHKQQRYKYGLEPHFKKDRRKANELFNPKTYKQRALCESINSAIKRVFGSWVCSRKPENQQKQTTIKAIAYNIELINRTIKIWLYINC